MARATGKDHARINLDIWGDDDWLDLTPAAQHLYFVLWTSPQLSYCGTGEWRPAKIAAKAKGWTAEQVELAGAELAAELFVIIDTDTEEFILRSWMKHDGLWRTPNMAVSMANARADLASRILRGIVVHEVLKIRKRNPESTAWERDAVVSMLEQAAIDPADLEPFNPTANPGSNGAVKGGSKGGSNPWVKGGVNPGATATPNPPAKGASNGGATPAPSPTPTSNSIKEGGYENTEGHQSSTTTEKPTYPDRCRRHWHDPNPPDCRHCANTRRASEALQTQLAAAAKQIQHDCPNCDTEGWARDDEGAPTIRCQHPNLTDTDDAKAAHGA